MADPLKIKSGTRMQIAFDVPPDKDPVFELVCTFNKVIDESAFLISVPMKDGKPLAFDDTRKLLIKYNVASDPMIIAGYADDEVKEGIRRYWKIRRVTEQRSFFKRADERVKVPLKVSYTRAVSLPGEKSRGVESGMTLDISAGGIIVTLLEMCFANEKGGIDFRIKDDDTCRALFNENAGVVIQVSDDNLAAVEQILKKADADFAVIGRPVPERAIVVRHEFNTTKIDIDLCRDQWMHTSYLLDRIQTAQPCADARYANYKKQPLDFKFPADFSGKLSQYGIDPKRRTKTGIKAAIMREKGINGDREMAYTMYLAGFDVKDVHMTDLASGRETLEDVNFIVYCGGFSNSDVLGSAKGWAGAFKYNEKTRKALENFYKRPDTLSLGVCNGCQLMNELELIHPGRPNHPKLLHNDSHKFESSFINVDILENNSVMLKTLAGCRLGVWVAHGEGKFNLPDPEDTYNIPMKYSYGEYPGNPNGSCYNAAAIVSDDGRHLSMMPHPERAIFSWQCAYYPDGRKDDETTPWLEAFVNARKWVEEKVKNK